MSDELKLVGKIAPEMLDVIKERFYILRNIHWESPVGRRTLSSKVGLTERVLRTETDALKSLNLIDSTKSGMFLTSDGEEVYKELENVMGRLLGMQAKERTLAKLFGIERCLIVAGDSDEEAKVLNDFGALVTETLNLKLQRKENIIAVMGGTTMLHTAETMFPLDDGRVSMTFVPARGGIGEAVSIQSNSVSELMALRTKSQHKTLYIPEQVSPETYTSLLQEPSIQEVLKMIEKADCVIHSIGKAIHMAVRRSMPASELAMLKEKKAVSESFGYFFNSSGEIVYKIPRIGLQLKDIPNIPLIIAVASGKSKAKAINSYMKQAPSQTWLMTDEGAANEILKEATL